MPFLQQCTFRKDLPFLFAAFLCWILANPYDGIWHDARVYLAQAYYVDAPYAYANDVWFMFGSQSKYTIFPLLYNFVLHALGVQWGSIVVTMLGGFTWLIGAYSLTKIFSGAMYKSTLLIFLCIPLWYAATTRLPLSLSESFATARPFAMGLSLLAFSLLYLKKYFIGFLLVMFSIFLHPLMAIWPLLAFCLFRCSWIHILRISLLFSSTLIFLFFLPARTGPFSLVYGEWFDLIKFTSSIVLIPSFSELNLDANLWWFSILMLGAFLCGPNNKKIYLVALFLGVFSLWFTIWISAVQPVKLFLQVQPWRALWFSTCIGVVAFSEVLQRLFYFKHRLTLLTILFLSFLFIGKGGGALFFVAITSFLFLKQYKWMIFIYLHLSSRIVLLSQCSFYVAIVFLAFTVLDFSDVFYQFSIGTNKFYFWVPTLVFSGLIPVLLLIFDSFIQRFLILFIVFLLIAVSMTWDQRSMKEVEIESGYTIDGSRAIFSDYVTRGDVVYWPRNELRVWFELGTASYASSTQAIGVVFSDRHAELLYQRLKLISLLSMGDGINEFKMLYPEFNLHAGGYHPSSLALTTIKTLCMDKGLDFVIDKNRYDGFYISSARETKRDISKLYLYSCEKIRLID